MFIQNTRKLSAIIGLTVVMILISVTTTFAAPGLPAQYYGSIQVDGVDTPEGTVVAASINGQEFAQTTTQVSEGNSVFSIIINGDDPDTPEKEGGVDGDVVTFTIGGEDADQTAPWSTTSLNQLDLTATTSSPNPPVSPSGQGNVLVAFTGALRVGLQDVIFPEQAILDEDVIVQTDSANWYASDTTGTDAGWRVNLSASGNFSDGNGREIPLNGFSIEFANNDISPRANAIGTPPNSLVATGGTLTTSGIDILAAPSGTALAPMILHHHLACLCLAALSLEATTQQSM